MIKFVEKEQNPFVSSSYNYSQFIAIKIKPLIYLTLIPKKYCLSNLCTELLYRLISWLIIKYLFIRKNVFKHLRLSLAFMYVLQLHFLLDVTISTFAKLSLFNLNTGSQLFPLFWSTLEVSIQPLHFSDSWYIEGKRTITTNSWIKLSTTHHDQTSIKLSV